MTAVNPLSRSRAAGAHEPVHAAAQMGRLMRHLSSTFAREDWNGLRQSHFRLMSSIPVAGITITDLADRLGMTKQASSSPRWRPTATSTYALIPTTGGPAWCS